MTNENCGCAGRYLRRAANGCCATRLCIGAACTAQHSQDVDLRHSQHWPVLRGLLNCMSSSCNCSGTMRGQGGTHRGYCLLWRL